MLVSAYSFKDVIEYEFVKRSSDDEMFYYTGIVEMYTPEIEVPNGEDFDYAIVDNEENEILLGYFSYSIDWRTRTLYNFGLYSFSKNNPTIGIDILRHLKQVIKSNKIHRVEYRMIGGNPVERHYDKFTKHYGGKKFIFTDSAMDKYGNYHNEIVYEIIFNN